MRTRSIPEHLYSEVFAIVTKIKDAALADDEAAQATHCDELRQLYERVASSGRVDPFLTEAMADNSDNPQEAVALYRLSLEQCAAFPDEPLHTKRIGLVRCLLDLSQSDDASIELDRARFEANRLGDTEALEEIAQLSRQMRSNNSSNGNVPKGTHR
jgi:hypothetical protein